MGVEYYTCAICGYNFPDCGEYVWCNDCGNRFCLDDCAGLQPVEDDENSDHTNCVICRKEAANDYILLETLLRHYNLNREDVLKIWPDQDD